MKFDALAVLTGLVGAAETAGPMGCGRCVEPMTGRTGSLRCEHAEEFATRLFHASAAIHAPPLPPELVAAPDLLAALKALTAIREGAPGFRDAFAGAMSAIARAEGRQS